MTTAYQRNGERLTITAGSAIAANSIVRVGNVVGVALGNLATGESGEIGLSGVYRVPKVTAAVIAQGGGIVFKAATANVADSTAATIAGDVAVGPWAYAAEAAGNGATTVLINLTRAPGVVV